MSYSKVNYVGLEYYKNWVCFFFLYRDLVQTNEITGCFVGQYVVFPKEFEKLVMPLFSNVSKICPQKLNYFSLETDKCYLPKFFRA